jgi:hypothetical protein
VEPLDLGPAGGLPETAPRRVVLLVGSPRGSASVSSSLASHLASLLSEQGLTVSLEWIHRSLHQDPELRSLAARLDEADLVVLATPLYVDSLPAPVTEAFEILARRAPGTPSRARLLALVNCGFPEAVHTDTALAICRLWAREAGLDWIGGLGIGGGGMFEGQPLAELGHRAQPLRRALALTASAIARGRVVPEEARRLARTLTIPPWLYRFFGDRGFRQQAKKHGMRARLGDRPYAAQPAH